MYSTSRARWCRSGSPTRLALLAPWPCPEAHDAPEHCVDWNDVAPLTDDPKPPVVSRGNLVITSDALIRVYNDFEGFFDLDIVLWLDGGPTSHLWIGLPEPARRVRIELARNGAAIIASALSGGAVVAGALSGGLPGWIELEANAIDWVQLTWVGEARVYVARICWTAEADAAQLDRDERWSTLAEALAESFASEEEVLEPDTAYLLEVKTTGERHKQAALDLVEERIHWAGFWSGGPPGLLPDRVPPAPAREETEPAHYPYGGKLADLAEYVRWPIPAPDAAPAYRAYDVGVEFNETYVEQMYGGDVVVRLLDANGDPLTDAEGAEVAWTNAWGRAPAGELSATEAAYVTAWENCAGSTAVVVLSDQRLLASSSALLYDDFSSESGAWAAVDLAEAGASDWHVANGTLGQTGTIAGGDPSPASPDKPGTLYVTGPADWADIGLEVKLSASSGAVGLVFRYVDPGNYYRLSVGPQRYRLVRMAGGNLVELWVSTRGYVAGATMWLAASCQGGRIRCQLGEELLCDLVDEDASTPAAGKAGLYAWNSDDAVFDDFLVRSWPGALLTGSRLWTAVLRGSRTMFASAFETTGSAGWSFLYLLTTNEATAPSVSGDSLVVHSEPGEDAVVALAGDVGWSDYTLEASATCLGTDQFGVAVRHGATESYYMLRMLPSGRRLWRRTPSGAALLWEDHLGTEPGREYALAVTCAGHSISVKVDGETLCSIVDIGLPNTLPSSGGIGLMGEGEHGAAFRHIVVRSSRAPVYSWRFTTSAYPGFAELAGSFNGVVDHIDGATIDPDSWTAWASSIEPELAAANAALEAARAELAAASASDVPALRAAALAAATARGDVAHSVWQGGSAAAGVGYRPRPPRVELSRLTDEAATRALLIEAPEPIHPDRATWIVAEVAADGSRSTLGDLTVAHSRDATSWLLFRSGGAAFAPADHVLIGVYHLNVGAERSVQYRGGSSLPEVSQLIFKL